jgi:hypothetical protein
MNPGSLLPHLVYVTSPVSVGRYILDKVVISLGAESLNTTYHLTY